jgi:phytoene dehydrogenase-like protein
MADYDILIVGAGHNALVCGAYLAKEGYHVGLVERRPKAGGAVVTEEHVPGYHFDLGGSAHILINHTSVVDDLNLREYGLTYLDCDPIFFAPFPDGTSITVYRDIDKTCASIAQVNAHDAEAYRQFVNEWWRFAEGMVESFLHPPTPFNLLRYMTVQSGMWRDMIGKLNAIRRGHGDFLRRTFQDERVRAMIAWMAAQSGPPPNEAFSAPLALWFPMYHVSGMKRPQGGSGMLTQALARYIDDHGGDVHLNQPVTQILVADGRAVGVETADGTRLLADKAVVSGAHIKVTMKLLGNHAPYRARRRVERARTGNGMGMITRFAMHDLPDYSAKPSGGDPAPHHQAIQFISPTVDYLNQAHADFLQGRPSKNPALAVMTVSAVDPTLAPPDKHVMFVWGQYYPYQLATGETWDEIGKRESDRMLAVLAEYAPNMTQEAVVGELIETPVFLERELGLVKGNIMHLEMSSDQMFFNRPALGMGMYRAPVDGLYLTGASTHPGGGIMGAAGRNAAHTIIHDLTSRFRLWSLLR